MSASATVPLVCGFTRDERMTRRYYLDTAADSILSPTTTTKELT